MVVSFKKLLKFKSLLEFSFQQSLFSSSIASKFLIEKKVKCEYEEEAKDNSSNIDENDSFVSGEKTNKKIVLRSDSVFVSDYNTGIDNESKENVDAKYGFKPTKVFELFGTPNPSTPVSNVPCHGCGALLHCKDPGLSGYLPSQIFNSVPHNKLNCVLCQRCRLLKKNKMALNINVLSENYKNVIKEIKKQTALILLVVDMMDLSNSFCDKFKYLSSIKRPMLVVGNKVDLLHKDTEGYLMRAKKCLMEVAEQNGFNENINVKHFFIISAKTGFGVEPLITTMLNEWKLKGNVFIVGTANSGKSTLFNTLLASDFCRSSAKEVINRATTSVWPGTTLNLLKFPILNPKPSKLYERFQRLKKQNSSAHYDSDEEMRLSMSRKKAEQPSLFNRIGSTFLSSSQMALVTQSQNVGFLAPSYVQNDELQPVTGLEQTVNYLDVKPLPYNDSTFKYWCYDTPGLINPEQVVNLLNQSELLSLVTKKEMTPQIYLMHVGQVLLVSGMARVEYLQGDTEIFATVYTSPSIPSHIFKNTQEADNFYHTNIGSSELGIPLGDSERLRNIPSLIASEFEITGKGLKETAADIVLSSIGWVSICCNRDKIVKVRAYTPGKRGLSMRLSALIKHPLENRGPRIKGTNKYKIITVNNEQRKK